jgi:phosphoglycerate dehydrogenase-like enzyme
VGQGLSGKTLGILGLGHIGVQMSRIAAAFQMNVVAWSQNMTSEFAEQHGARLVSKSDLFEQSQFVTIHLVLSERTRHLVGAPELELLGPRGYLINTSRGPIVDEEALLDALNSDRIAGAALDVFDVEPLPHDHPLRRAHNVVLTPHIGYVTSECYEIFFDHIVEDIEGFLKGEPVRQISGEG